jgi:Family of unknown function (DUF5990)
MKMTSLLSIVIEGHTLPGRSFCSDGMMLESVHVAVQVGTEAIGPVRGDAESARWEVDVTVIRNTVDAATSEFDFRGKAVHGKAGERFLYLTWGNIDDAGKFAMFRRAKLMLHRVDPQLIDEAVARSSGDGANTALVAAVSLTDDRGCPRCARVDPPAIRWTVRPAS